MEYTFRIEQDTDVENTREWEGNLTTMTCWHRRYILGDSQPKVDGTDWLVDLAGYDQDWVENNLERLSKEQVLARIERKYYIKPLYLYDHSGITIATTPFSCRWDSGQIGWITIPKHIVWEAYKGNEAYWKQHHNIKSQKDLANHFIQAEVETYDQYLTGDTWGYIIEDEDGEEVDSCWGIYGKEEAERQAEEVVESLLLAEQEEA